MKKKNLLTLGALCLSLGLVVSSCNQTTPGTPGEPGKPGEDGQPGKDGVDGKTYKDVIVIHDNNLDGGDVEQDVFFVTEGEHDKVTFTFVPEDESNNIVIDFEINGEIVEDLDPSATSYTIEDADKYEGTIQVTGATFTSIDAYGSLLLERHVEELNKNDKALGLTKMNGNLFLEEDDINTNAYSSDATAVVQEAYADANDEVVKAVESAKKDHKDDVKAQVEAIKEAAQKGIEAIDAAYEEAVKDAIVQAKSDLEDLAGELTHENYTEEDAKKDLDTYSAKIDAATSIEGLGNLINGASLNKGTKGAEANLFYGAKAFAFGEVDSALEELVNSGLAGELDPTDEDNAQLLATLKAYGVDTSKLPSEIAKEYYAKISASTDVKVVLNNKNQPYTELGKEGADAVTDSVLGIKDTLVEAIKAKYEAEINDSKVLVNNASTKTALLGVLETAVSNYVTADKDQTRFSISQYVSTEVKPGSQLDETSKKITAGTNTLGLIGYVEYCLNQPVNGSTNEAWLAERIANAKASVGTQLEEARKAISDSRYDSLTSYKSEKENNTTYYTPEEALLLKGDGKTEGSVYGDVENPFFGKLSTDDNDHKGTTTTLTSFEGDVESAVVGTTTVTPNYNLDDWLDTLSKATVPTPTSEMDGDKWVGGTLFVESWVESHRADFAKIYKSGLDLIKGKQSEKNTLSGVVNSVLTDSENGLPSENAYITSGTLWNKWDVLSSDPESNYFADAETLVSTAEGITKSVSVLSEANEKINAYLEEKALTDADFSAYFGGYNDGSTSLSLTRKAFEQEVSDIMAGKVNSAQLTSWFNRLDSVYKNDVAEYFADVKDIFTQTYQNLISDATKVEDYRKLTSVYDSFESFVGHKLKPSNGKYVVDDAKGTFDFTCQTIASVNKWFDAAQKSLAKKEVTIESEASSTMPSEVTLASEPVEFSITFNPSAANYGKKVIVSSENSNASIIEKVEYLEVNGENAGKWFELTGDFGPSAGFPYQYATSTFRVTFKGTGENTLTVKVKDASTKEVLDTYTFTINVKAAE